MLNAAEIHLVGLRRSLVHVVLMTVTAVITDTGNLEFQAIIEVAAPA